MEPHNGDPHNGLPKFWGHINRLAGVTMLLLLVWTAFAEIDVSVKGTGRTISSGENKVIQHLEGGILAAIKVHEGQAVTKGDILFRVRNESNTSALRENEIQLASLTLRIMRLKAEENGTEPVFPEALQNTVPDAVAREQRAFISRQQQRFEELRVFEQQGEQKKRTLAELTARVRNVQQELNTAKKQYAIVKDLVAAGAASTNRLLEAESKVNRFQTDISSTQQTIPITSAELNEAIGRLREATARQKNDISEELREATLERDQLDERLKADRDKVERTEVLSPVNGVVNRLYVHTVGGTIRPSETLAEITPADDTVIVEAKIAPEHRAKIWEGQTANINITAFEYSTYGLVKGKIVDISADSLYDEQSQRTYYRVKIVLEHTKIGDNKRIMPGMLTEVNILTGKRTILDYLLRPLIHVRDSAFTES
jgi:adhesin transport system membrane fusion protein